MASPGKSAHSVADEDKEMLLLIGATLRSMARHGLLKKDEG
jgi:hypothetical protein